MIWWWKIKSRNEAPGLWHSYSLTNQNPCSFAKARKSLMALISLPVMSGKEVWKVETWRMETTTKHKDFAKSVYFKQAKSFGETARWVVHRYSNRNRNREQYTYIYNFDVWYHIIKKQTNKCSIHCMYVWYCVASIIYTTRKPGILFMECSGPSGPSDGLSLQPGPHRCPQMPKNCLKLFKCAQLSSTVAK